MLLPSAQKTELLLVPPRVPFPRPAVQLGTLHALKDFTRLSVYFRFINTKRSITTHKPKAHRWTESGDEFIPPADKPVGRCLSQITSTLIGSLVYSAGASVALLFWARLTETVTKSHFEDTYSRSAKKKMLMKTRFFSRFLCDAQLCPSVLHIERWWPVV